MSSRKLGESELEVTSSEPKKARLDTAEADSDVEDLEEEEAVESKTGDEENCGIREFANPHIKRFEGTLKKSPSDFIVNEIDPNGDVVRLTSYELPFSSQPKAALNGPELEQAKSKMSALIGLEKFNGLIEFLESNSREKTFSIEAPKDKQDRKLVHEFIKKNFPNHNTNTIQNSQQQTIQICHNSYKRDSMKDCYKNSSHREIDESKHCVCVMYKENIDTIQAVNLIAKGLRVNIKRVGYAGTKDKRAKTSQRISFFKVDPRQLLGLNKMFHNVKLGNFKLTKDNGIRLGDLSGNRFKIVIRNVNEPDDVVIGASLESVKTNGFINYFGLQRFGNCSQIPTHSIGKLLILNELKEAIDMILKPRDSEMEKSEIKRARAIWDESRDANRAFMCLHNVNCIEKYLLKGLAHSDKNDHLRAFQNLPRNMRLMYLHAYQSFVWNEAASKRIGAFGLEPRVGDLAMLEDNQVVRVTDANVGRFKIDDVVLPLPGHDVLYPDNSIGQFYDEILAKDGIKRENFRNKIKDFSLSGDYRKILIRPKDLAYEIVSYTDETVALAKSDLDLLSDVKPEENKSLSENSEAKKAIILEFSLPTSAYATVALREIFKEIK